MDRLTNISYVFTGEDDVFGLIAHASDSARAFSDIDPHRYEGEFLFADTQVTGKCLSASLTAHIFHPLFFGGTEKRLRRSATRLNLPQESFPGVLVPRFWHPIRNMAFEENIVSVVVPRGHAWLSVWVHCLMTLRQNKSQK